MAEPRNPAQQKLRDWPMFQIAPGKRRSRPAILDGRQLPRISELVMAHVQGTPAEKLVWLLDAKATGKLDGDDPEEIGEAEALLAMLMRIAASKGGGKEKRHIDELLDEGLRETFPASDPVSVGHFTGTEPASRPADRGDGDLSLRKTKGRAKQKARVRRSG